MVSMTQCPLIYWKIILCPFVYMYSVVLITVVGAFLGSNLYNNNNVYHDDDTGSGTECSSYILQQYIFQLDAVLFILTEMYKGKLNLKIIRR